MKGKVYFVSDAHLGSGADSRQRELELCRWLESIKGDCGTLVLLGDMFDFWFSYRHVVPRGNVRLLGKLAEMADSGIEIHFFIGNHDMWVFDYLTEECGIIVHDDPMLMHFGDKTFYVGHGDGLGDIDRSFRIVRRFFRSRVCQRLFALLPTSLTFPIARRWSDNNKIRHESEDCQRYLGDDREGIVIHCRKKIEQEKIDFCVFAHRHTPVERQLSDTCTYINTGDWLKNRTYAVFDPDSGKMELGSVKF